MGNPTKEDIILLFLEDPKKLAAKIWSGSIPKSNEIRTLICELENPECVCLYADYVDKSPHPDTRETACKDPICAYFYARDVDKSPHSDTRQAVQNDLHWKKEYEEWEKECLLKKK